MAESLRPVKGGFLRPFGCGWFIRQYLAGMGPEGSTKIDPTRGAPQADIAFAYKETLATVTARERAEKIVSDRVVKKVDVSEAEAEEIYQNELKKVSRKFTHMRYHSFLMYFSVLKKLNWVAPSGESEDSGIQDNYSAAPNRIYYRLTEAGKTAADELWSNPLFTLYPENGANHKKKSEY
jgi:hypothetical protein